MEASLDQMKKRILEYRNEMHNSDETLKDIAEMIFLPNEIYSLIEREPNDQKRINFIQEQVSSDFIKRLKQLSSDISLYCIYSEKDHIKYHLTFENRREYKNLIDKLQNILDMLLFKYGIDARIIFEFRSDKFIYELFNSYHSEKNGQRLCSLHTLIGCLKNFHDVSKRMIKEASYALEESKVQKVRKIILEMEMELMLILEKELLSNKTTTTLPSPEKNEGEQAGGYIKQDVIVDELYDQAVQIVIDAKSGSASLLQRKLRIGYTRAARLIDIMQENGILGPSPGNGKPRELIILET